MIATVLAFLTLFILSFRYAHEEPWDSKVVVYAGSEELSDMVKNSASLWDGLSALDVVYGGVRKVSYAIREDCSVSVNTPFEGVVVVKAQASKCKEKTNAMTYRLGAKSFLIVLYREKKRAIYDYSILIHELGHALGLDHPFERGEEGTISVMNYYPYVSAFPTRDDMEVLQGIYGKKRKDKPNLFYPTDGVLCIGGMTPPIKLNGCRLEPYPNSVQCFRVLEGNCALGN